MSVTVRDNGYEAMFKRLADKNQGRVVDVGVLGKKGAGIYEGTGLTVADVASFHEFGRGNHERSFIRDYVDENRAKIEDLLRKMAIQVIKGEVTSFDAGLELIGFKLVGEIQARIRAGIDPENALSTIERKGSSTPLVGVTSQLINSIVHELRRASGGS